MDRSIRMGIHIRRVEDTRLSSATKRVVMSIQDFSVTCHHHLLSWSTTWSIILLFTTMKKRIDVSYWMNLFACHTRTHTHSLSFSLGSVLVILLGHSWVKRMSTWKMIFERQIMKTAGNMINLVCSMRKFILLHLQEPVSLSHTLSLSRDKWWDKWWILCCLFSGGELGFGFFGGFLVFAFCFSVLSFPRSLLDFLDILTYTHQSEPLLIYFIFGDKRKPNDLLCAGRKRTNPPS